MKKLDRSIIAALILVAGAVLILAIYLYFSPYQICTRAWGAWAEDSGHLARMCLDKTVSN